MSSKKCRQNFTGLKPGFLHAFRQAQVKRRFNHTYLIIIPQAFVRLRFQMLF